MRPRTGNRIADLSFDFSIMILDYCDMLTAQKRYTVANQLSRCATSIGANIAEAQSSESLADFIHKMKIADKEARETEYWLEICKYAEGYEFDDALLQSSKKLLGCLQALYLQQRASLETITKNNITNNFSI